MIGDEFILKEKYLENQKLADTIIIQKTKRLQMNKGCACYYYFYRPSDCRTIILTSKFLNHYFIKLKNWR